MKKHIASPKERRGVALIMSVGILALLAMIATGFAINMQLEYKAAANYLRYADATVFAEAGIDKAISDIRYWVANNGYNTVLTNIANNYPSAGGSEVSLADGTYQVNIEREDTKININALDETDSVWIDTLFNQGLAAGLTADQIGTMIGRVIDYRDPDATVTTQILRPGQLVNLVNTANNENAATTKNAPYATLEELKLALYPILNNNTMYDAIVNDITIYAPIIKGGLIGKYYFNRTSFDKNTILSLNYYKGKVIELGKIREYYMAGVDSIGWREAHDAEWAGGYIVTDWSSGLGAGKGFNTEGLINFGAVFTGFVYIPVANQSITFYKRSDDGMRLYIDGVLIINDWNDRGMEGGSGTSGSRTFGRAGWHPIRIEYYENTGDNGLELRWNALGSTDYVPAEYLGYYPASYYGNIWNDGSGSYATPTTSYLNYYSAGIFKITSKGKAKSADGTVLATKEITTSAHIFDTWTQTTRAEFYAPWFGDSARAAGGDNFSDGEIYNVTWMNSCPVSTDGWNAVNNRMNWEGNYSTIPDSLKLGFWDNFDEDVGYSVVNLRGGQIWQVTGVTGWSTRTYPPDTTVYNVPDGFNQFWGQCTTSYPEFNNDYGADGSHCLNINCQVYTNGLGQRYSEEKTAELNYYYYGCYYEASPPLGYDIFVRARMRDNGQEQQDSATWQRAPANRLTNPGQPVAAYTPSWMGGWVLIKEAPYGAAGTVTYWMLIKDGDIDIFGGDASELQADTNVQIGFNPPFPPAYPKDTITNNTNPYVLAAIGVGANYQIYFSYNTGVVTGFQAGASRGGVNSTAQGVVKLRGLNSYNLPKDSGFAPKIAFRNADWFGCDSGLMALFDNVRIIYPSGYLVSTPFVAAYPTENANITWGTISWSALTPGSTDIKMYARTNIAASDTFLTTLSNGAQLSAFNGNKQIQYKALLSTTALNAGNYSASSVTPVLGDVTITYFRPKVEIFYRK